METNNISLPTKIEYSEGSKPNETVLTIEPLYPGYGHTVGVALRRALLSSLEGGAIVAVKIKGAQHEFSTLPYVAEDVVDIILNLKKVRFRVFSDETVRVTLKVRGEKEVTAADIESTNEAEVANPESVICSLTNKNAQLEMELFVKKGRGYLPTEAREKENLEIGTIAIDALFTPVRNVGLQIDNVRVGQMTNFNKITMQIETDGSIAGQMAVEQAAQCIVDHFSLLLNVPAGHAVAESDELTESDSAFTSDTADETETEIVHASADKKEPKKRGRPKKGE